MAVPKKMTYSVVEACRIRMAPIHPPAFTKIHSITEEGRMWLL